MEVSAIDWHKLHQIWIDGVPAEERPIQAEGGYSRKIVFAKDLVIKITFASVGSHIWDQSTNELKIWETLRPEDRPHFAEIVGGGRVKGMDWSWVAQRYLNFEAPWPTYQVPVEIATLIDDLKYRYSLRDLDGNYCGRNWAMVNGVPVIYDYGSVENEWGNE